MLTVTVTGAADAKVIVVVRKLEIPRLLAKVQNRGANCVYVRRGDRTAFWLRSLGPDV